MSLLASVLHKITYTLLSLLLLFLLMHYNNGQRNAPPFALFDCSQDSHEKRDMDIIPCFVLCCLLSLLLAHFFTSLFLLFPISLSFSPLPSYFSAASGFHWAVHAWLSFFLTFLSEHMSNRLKTSNKLGLDM
jgi:hypothetical protein